MIFKYITVIFIIILLFSCKTVKSVVYDKNLIKNEYDLKLIHKMIEDGDFKNAEESISIKLKLFPDNLDVLILQGWLYLKQNNFDESRNVFNKVIQKNKNVPLAYLGLARMNRIENNYTDAEINIKKAMVLNSLTPEIWFEKGLIEYNQEKYKEALIDFTKAHTLDLKNNDMYFFKFITMLKTGRNLDEIKNIWNEITSSNTLKSYYYTIFSSTLIELNNSKDGGKVLEQGYIKFPDDSIILNNLAYFYYNKYSESKNIEDLNTSEKYINICLTNIKNTNLEIIDTYFLILFAQGKKELIKIELAKYMYQYPDSEIIIKWIKYIK